LNIYPLFKKGHKIFIDNKDIKTYQQ